MSTGPKDTGGAGTGATAGTGAGVADCFGVSFGVGFALVLGLLPLASAGFVLALRAGDFFEDVAAGAAAFAGSFCCCFSFAAKLPEAQADMVQDVLKDALTHTRTRALLL